jgi:hypothetical protein
MKLSFVYLSVNSTLRTLKSLFRSLQLAALYRGCYFSKSRRQHQNG